MAPDTVNLVTGASGFLGGYLVEELVNRGAAVRVMGRPTSRVCPSPGVEIVASNPADPASLDRAMDGVAHVFHCAARVTDFGSWSSFHEANVALVSELLRAAARNQVRRFVHVSTTDVYGYPNLRSDETAPLRKRGWPYADTKIDGEKLVWRVHRESGLPVTIIRPVSIYGPRSSSLVLEIVKLLKAGQMMHISGGHSIAGTAYVTNVVDLMLLAADAPAAVGQAYNASDGTSHTWRDYVDRLADILSVKRPVLSIPRPIAYGAGWVMEKTIGKLSPHRRPLLTRMAVEIFGTHQDFPIEKARRELGYKPAIDFDEGMGRVKLWLREIGEI